MTDHIIYMDNAATTATRPEVLEAMLPYFTQHYGNPSSIHSVGRDARRAVEKARQQVAAALGAQPREIYFTAGGSESDNWAIRCASKALAAKGKHIITTQIEHHAVLHTCQYMEKQGYEVTYLPVDENGLVSVEDVKKAIRPDTVLISIMAANNEIGTIEPIREIGKVAHEAGVLFHTDAVQAVGAVPIDVNDWNVDMLSLSGHKFHAPKGIGALYIRAGLHLAPLIVGGSQEEGRRAGTEAMPNICAFGEAARLARELMAESSRRMAALRESTVERLLAENPGLVVIGGGAPHILCISLPGYRSEVLMNFLEARSVSLSRSSACKKGGRSHVLEAMRLPAPVIDGALRLGLSRYTTAAELDAFCAFLREARESLAHS